MRRVRPVTELPDVDFRSKIGTIFRDWEATNESLEAFMNAFFWGISLNEFALPSRTHVSGRSAFSPTAASITVAPARDSISSSESRLAGGRKKARVVSFVSSWNSYASITECTAMNRTELYENKSKPTRSKLL